MKTLLGDLNARVGRENIFKPTIWNESLHQDRGDNGVRMIKFATSKNLVFKSTLFPHRNIHTNTWASPDGKTYKQIDHILIGRRWRSSLLDVRSFRVADYDTDHYLLVAKIRESLAVSTQAAQKFDEERFNLRKLSELEVRKQHLIKISNRFADLKNLIDSKDKNGVWKNIKEDTKISATESLDLCG
jgi:hypothetical protein